MEAIHQLHVERVIGWIQQHMLITLMVQKDNVAVGEAEKIKLKKLANKGTKMVCGDSIFVDFMKTILKVTVAVGNNYNTKFASCYTINIIKDMMCSAFLIGMSTQSYY